MDGPRGGLLAAARLADEPEWSGRLSRMAKLSETLVRGRFPGEEIEREMRCLPLAQCRQARRKLPRRAGADSPTTVMNPTMPCSPSSLAKGAKEMSHHWVPVPRAGGAARRSGRPASASGGRRTAPRPVPSYAAGRNKPDRRRQRVSCRSAFPRPGWRSAAAGPCRARTPASSIAERTPATGTTPTRAAGPLRRRLVGHERTGRE